MDESERLNQEIEILKNESARGILNALVDIQDSLTQKLQDGPEKDIAEVVNNALLLFSESSPDVNSVTPRVVREQDRRKILPGQHAGFTIRLSLPDGNQLRVNVYGGLRGFTAVDMRDSDKTGTNIHSQRTDKVLSQPTEVNWHIKRPDDTTLCDIWIKATQNRISLDKMIYEGERVDILAAISPDTYHFKEMSLDLGKNIKKLVDVIPTNY